MWADTKKRLRRLRGQSALPRFALAVACVFVLAGCASRVRTQVTSYQQWPVDAAGALYRIVPDTSANNLEFQAVAGMVRAQMGATGLVEAAHDQTARFQVHLQYQNPETEVWAQRYVDGFYPWFSPYFGVHGRHFGWGGSFWFPPSWVTVPVAVQKNRLTVTMTDTQRDHAEVYRATAEHLGHTPLIQVMPYLAQALFDDFPGNNGAVRQVEIPLAK